MANPASQPLSKEVVHLPDGRRLILYRFPEPAPAKPAAPPPPAPAPPAGER
jgi:hypothetical protein